MRSVHVTPLSEEIKQKIEKKYKLVIGQPIAAKDGTLQLYHYQGMLGRTAQGGLYTDVQGRWVAFSRLRKANFTLFQKAVHKPVQNPYGRPYRRRQFPHESCQISGCLRPVKCIGLCNPHHRCVTEKLCPYRCVLRHGKREIEKAKQWCKQKGFSLCDLPENIDQYGLRNGRPDAAVVRDSIIEYTENKIGTDVLHAHQVLRFEWMRQHKGIEVHILIARTEEDFYNRRIVAFPDYVTYIKGIEEIARQELIDLRALSTVDIIQAAKRLVPQTLKAPIAA